MTGDRAPNNDTRAKRRTPTHTLTIVVPLHLNGVERFDYDPVYDTLRVVASVSRMAADGVICDDMTVSLDEVPS